MPLLSEETQGLAERWPLLTRFDLSPDSVVVVVGAYKGLAMEALHEIYAPARTIGYEPQEWAFQDATSRLAEKPGCEVQPYGLGVIDGTFDMGEFHTDACSFINTGLNSRLHGKGKMRDADIALKSAVGSEKINLLIMNIEGYEYELLPYLIEKGWLRQVDRLAVQWHLNLGNDGHINEILAQIDETHNRVLDEFPAWIYWTKK